MDRHEAQAIIFDVIDVVNRQLPEGGRLAKQTDTVLAGAGGPLDSLGLIGFVQALEQQIEETAGQSMNLLDENLFTADEGPFRTVGTLAAFLAASLTQPGS